MADPVAWRVKDFADGWILCRTEDEARRLAAEGAGNLVQPLYTSAPSSPTATEVAETVQELRRRASASTGRTLYILDVDAELDRRAASLIERLAGKEEYQRGYADGYAAALRIVDATLNQTMLDRVPHMVQAALSIAQARAAPLWASPHTTPTLAGKEVGE